MYTYSTRILSSAVKDACAAISSSHLESNKVEPPLRPSKTNGNTKAFVSSEGE